MLATLSSSAPVTAVLAGLWKDDLLGAKPLQQLQQPLQQLQQPLQQVALPSLLVLQQQKQPTLQQVQPVLSQPQQTEQQPAAVRCGQLQPSLVSSATSSGPQQQQQQQHQGQPPCSTSPDGGACSPSNSTSPKPTRAGYSSDSYWNDRYAEKSTHFDWFYSYSALASLIRATCSTQGPCLHVGCGNSGLSDGMVQDGFQVVNVDISDVVIEQMRRMHPLPGQSWEVADCRSMPQFSDASFGSVLDKGTLDAVLCSSHGQSDTADYMNEVHRLLVPGGVFLLISLGQPHARLSALNAGPAKPVPAPLPYLSEKYQQAHAAAMGVGSSSPYSWSWESVEVYLLPKPSLYLASELSLTGKVASTSTKHTPHTDKDMPVSWLGPFAAGDELDAAIASEELELREFFTAFACKKKPGEQQPADAVDMAVATAVDIAAAGVGGLVVAAEPEGDEEEGVNDVGTRLDNAAGAAGPASKEDRQA